MRGHGSLSFFRLRVGCSGEAPLRRVRSWRRDKAFMPHFEPTDPDAERTRNRERCDPSPLRVRIFSQTHTISCAYETAKSHLQSTKKRQARRDWLEAYGEWLKARGACLDACVECLHAIVACLDAYAECLKASAASLDACAECLKASVASLHACDECLKAIVACLDACGECELA